jgi:hypothetical protein
MISNLKARRLKLHEISSSSMPFLNSNQAQIPQKQYTGSTGVWVSGGEIGFQI